MGVGFHNAKTEMLWHSEEIQTEWTEWIHKGEEKSGLDMLAEVLCSDCLRIRSYLIKDQF